MVKLFDPLLTPAVKLNQTPAGAYAIEEDQRQQETEQAQAALRDSRNGESSSADLLGTTYLTPMPGVVSADPAVLKADFREFLKAIWAYLRLPPPTQLQLGHRVLAPAFPRSCRAHGLPGRGEIVDHRGLRAVAPLL